VPLALPVFYFATSEKKSRFYFVSLFFALMFFTNFGRALFILLCFLVWYACAGLFELVRLGIRLADVLRTAAKDMAQLSAFLWLILLWMIGAQQFAFYRPIQSEVGGVVFYNIWDAVINFTFGYGTATKQAWAGLVRGTFLVFNDTNIWPVTTLLFIPFIMGMLVLLKNVLMGWKDKNEKLFKRDGYLVVFALISVSLLFSRGIIGARFHFFYFLPFAVACSMALTHVVSFFKDDRKKWLVFVFVFAEGTYVAYSSSWINWTYSMWDERLFSRGFALSLLMTLVFGMAAFLGHPFRERLARYWVRSFLVLLFVFLLARGPLVWGTQVYSDPDYVNNLFGLEGDEDTIVEFAVQRNRPDICYKLPQEYQDRCLSLVKGKAK
jgi:hypothetical protein